MSFGIFVGVNNHFESIIFAGVLMTDETADSFEWVFNEFVVLMGGKRPQTILTVCLLILFVALYILLYSWNYFFQLILV
jgi:hypothetical protein